MSFSLSHSELSFPREDSTHVVTLTNGSGVEASFKVRMTHPGNTTARPSKGIVAPGGSVEFEVLLKGSVTELSGQAPRMLVQCCDAESNVLWKQRLAMHILSTGNGQAAAPHAGLTIDTTPHASLLPTDSASDASPATSPAVGSVATNPSFNINVKILTLTSPVPLTGASYSIDWKRSSQEGTTRPVAPAGAQCLFNQSIVVPGCVAVYKDGKALKKHLVFTVSEGGVPLGSVKIQASEFSAEQTEGEVAIKLTVGGVVHQGTLGLVVAMTQASAAKATLSEGVSPQGSGGAVVTTSGASSTTPSRVAGTGRSFIDISAMSGASTPKPAAAQDSENHYNPLEDGLSPMNQAPLDQNIQVLVRVRPGDDCVWKVDPSACSISDEEKTHNFDRVLSQDQGNKDVWNLVGPRFIDAVTSGINGTIFMYGQTGSGKTHTMFGKPNEPGLTTLLFTNLFDRIASLTAPGMAFKVTACYFEIYNEQVNDLLVADPKKGNDLKVRDKGDSFSVPDLNVETVQSMQDCRRLLEQGGSRKVMGYSKLNQDSSRSHTIFNITVTCDMNQNGKKVKKMATLNFCDLAGSENMNADGDVKQRKETVNINKSLTYLKQVIKDLAGKSKHVAYRNSVLTRILKQSLGGNARTSVIITIHPGREQQKDSRNSIWFGVTARTVKNRAKINQEVDDRALRPLVKRLQAELESKEDELQLLRRVRDDYVALQEEYKAIVEENAMLRAGATVGESMEKRYGLDAVPEGPPQPHSGGSMSAEVPAVDQGNRSMREEALMKKLSEKDREIIDLKLGHSRELMAKTRQLQRALEEQEQEETAIELMQKDDRLDKLVHEILSYLHYGTKITRIEGKGVPERRLLYLVTDEGQQYACVCPLTKDDKGQKDSILEKIPMKDVKKTVMGQYGSPFEKAKPQVGQSFDQSFSIVGKKSKRIDIVCDTSSDFEAWIQSLNHLTSVRAEWGDQMDITGMEQVEPLDTEERALCATMHIMPIDYLHARSQVVNKEGKFITLFDVRTLSCLDMYHSQKLFGFFMSKGWIGQRKLYYLDTETISKTPGVYEVEYQDDDSEEEEPVFAAPSAAHTASVQPSYSHAQGHNAGPAPSYG